MMVCRPGVGILFYPGEAFCVKLLLDELRTFQSEKIGSSSGVMKSAKEVK